MDPGPTSGVTAAAAQPAGGATPAAAPRGARTQQPAAKAKVGGAKQPALVQRTPPKPDVAHPPTKLSQETQDAHGLLLEVGRQRDALGTALLGAVGYSPFAPLMQLLNKGGAAMKEPQTHQPNVTSKETEDAHRVLLDIGRQCEGLNAALLSLGYSPFAPLMQVLNKGGAAVKGPQKHQPYVTSKETEDAHKVLLDVGRQCEGLNTALLGVGYSPFAPLMQVLNKGGAAVKRPQMQQA